MHELTIARNILEIICQSVQRENFAQAESVKVKVGKLSNILPEALLFSFDSIKEDYGLEDTLLVIEEEPLHLLCRNCGRKFDSSDIVFICRYCKSGNLKVIDGDLLQVSEITLKEEI